MYLSIVPPSASTAAESASSRRLISVGQPLGLVLEALRHRGEAAHVAEQHRQVAALAAELQRRWGCGRARRPGRARDSARRPRDDLAAQLALAHEVEAEARRRTRPSAAATGRTGGAQIRPKRRAAIAAEPRRRRARMQRQPGPPGRAPRRRSGPPTSAAADDRAPPGRGAATGRDEEAVAEVVEDRRLHLDAGRQAARCERVRRSGTRPAPAVPASGAALRLRPTSTIWSLRRPGGRNGRDRGPDSRTPSDRSAPARSAGSARPRAAPAPRRRPMRSTSAAKLSASRGIRRR